MNNWYYFVWLSGDQIAEQYVYHLNMVSWAKGDEHPVEADGTSLFSQNRHIRGYWGSPSQFAEGTDGYSNLTGKILGKHVWEYKGPPINMIDQEHIDLIKAIREDRRRHEG